MGRRPIEPPTWVAIVLGAAAALFGAFALGLVVLQRFMLSAMPPPDTEPMGAMFAQGMNALHHLWFIHMPIWIAGGLILAAAGWAYHKEWPLAVWTIRVCCVLALVEFLAYSLHAWFSVMPVMKPLFALHPLLGSNFDGFFVVSFVVNFLFVGVPLGLLMWLTFRSDRLRSEIPYGVGQ